METEEPDSSMCLLLLILWKNMWLKGSWLCKIHFTNVFLNNKICLYSVSLSICLSIGSIPQQQPFQQFPRLHPLCDS